MNFFCKTPRTLPAPEPAPATAPVSKREWKKTWKISFIQGSLEGQYMARRAYVSARPSQYLGVRIFAEGTVLRSDTIEGLRIKIREHDAVEAKGQAEAASLQAEVDAK